MAASAASVLAFAAPAFAADTPNSTDVTINGTVDPQCGVGNQSGGGVRHGTSAIVNLPSMVDANGQLSVAPVDIEFNNVWCNSSNEVTMTVTSLNSGVTVFDTSSFVNRLDMHVTRVAGVADVLLYFGNPTEVATGAGGSTGTLSHVNPAAFETGDDNYARGHLTVTLPAGTVGNDRPVAGTYTGVITFTATPHA